MINIKTSYGEFMDKISILKVKLENIDDTDKKKQILNELEILQQNTSFMPKEQFEFYLNKLYLINKDIWSYEHNVRVAIKNNNNNDIIKNATLICRNNDIRFQIKQEINILLKSNINEVKQHIKY